MNVELIKCPTGTYKIITNSAKKHPVLVHLAQLLNGANKGSGLHVGVYSVSGGFLDTHIRVYSYISGKAERMSRKQYYKWLKGNRQIYTPKSKKWIPEDGDKEIEELLEGIK